MRSREWSCLVCSLAILLAATVAPLVQDPKPVGTPDGETLRQALALASKTAEHERLAKLAGKWQVAVRTRRAEGGDMSEDRGTVVGQAILGGRYVVLNYQLKLQGRPVEAVQIVGFDTLRNAYTSSWRDSESTWSVECLGGIGKDADVLTLSGSLRDAKSPDGRDYRVSFDLRSKDRVTVRMHEARGLDEVLLQEQDWQR